MPTARTPEVDRRWLDYAWRVLNCPEKHRRRCVEAGAAIPGLERVDGDDLRWPGYLGRDWKPYRGVLCVGAVHREPSPEYEDNGPVGARTNAELIEGARRWLRDGRSTESDGAHLDKLRNAYEEALPSWPSWKRHFRTLVGDYLNLSVTEIAWTNLAKCRVPIHSGDSARRAEAQLTRLCQADFAPVSDLVDRIRPVAVLVAVLNAGSGGPIVSSWESPNVSPLVYTWQGQSGHDRHNTDPRARKLREWAPEMAAQVRQAMEGVSG